MRVRCRQEEASGSSLAANMCSWLKNNPICHFLRRSSTPPAEPPEETVKKVFPEAREDSSTCPISARSHRVSNPRRGGPYSRRPLPNVTEEGGSTTSRLSEDNSCPVLPRAARHGYLQSLRVVSCCVCHQVVVDAGDMMRKSLQVVSCCVCHQVVVDAGDMMRKPLQVVVDAGDMMRKSIVFDKKTPDVFYCPQHKPTGFDKLLVRARPLSKLCQFGGQPIPEDYKSDCYNDVDESEYACKEKYRIMTVIFLAWSKLLDTFLHCDVTEPVPRRPQADGNIPSVVQLLDTFLHCDVTEPVSRRPQAGQILVGFNKEFSDQFYSNKEFSDQFYSNKEFSDHFYSNKEFSDHFYSNKEFSDHFYSNKKFSDHFYSNKEFSDHSIILYQDKRGKTTNGKALTVVFQKRLVQKKDNQVAEESSVTTELFPTEDY
uniref:(California timema) hypothetical protein n=1 Tax=Timema californicum TaxID=61474 RepID=A0A7R9JGJ1_TIMCA|nr:unnamed protein product [Timema californicum]